jgi:hypothetical protein
METNFQSRPITRADKANQPLIVKDIKHVRAAEQSSRFIIQPQRKLTSAAATKEKDEHVPIATEKDSELYLEFELSCRRVNIFGFRWVDTAPMGVKQRTQDV